MVIKEYYVGPKFILIHIDLQVGQTKTAQNNPHVPRKQRLKVFLSLRKYSIWILRPNNPRTKVCDTESAWLRGEESRKRF